MFKNINIKFLFFLFFYIPIFSTSYKVEFQGVENKKLLTLLKNSSTSVKLQSQPIRSIHELQFRVEKDIKNLKTLVKNFGYLDADISFEIFEKNKKLYAIFYFNLYERYTLSAYNIYSFPCEEKCEIIKDVKLKNINIFLKNPITTKEIISSKQDLLNVLKEKGFPLAEIEKDEILADFLSKTITINIYVKKGPLCNFGHLNIFGLEDIKPEYIYKKIAWKEEEKFSLKKIKETQKRITNTNLFSSVIIEHEDKLDDSNLLPMKIYLTKAKHQNISFGASYATVDGPGVLFGWTHRNIRHMGEILNIETDISKRGNLGAITYKKPDFYKLNQALVLQGFAIREDITAYLSFTYGALAKLDNHINKLYYSYGIRTEHINAIHSANDGRFQLLSLPVNLQYTTTKHLLNPLKGYTIIYTTIPFVSICSNKSLFLKQRISFSIYLPLDNQKKLVLSTRIQLGSILGASIYKIPINKLFLGGSDDDLRGYKYKTVGPRNSQGDIIGGRSFIYFNLEPRFRISKTLGLVPFLDLGNVAIKKVPDFKTRFRKSVGIGFRYFSFFGPLRLDVAFPLDKYKEYDAKYRFYVSIGQTF